MKRSTIFLAACLLVPQTQAQIVLYEPVNELDAVVQAALSFEIASLRLEAEAWDEDARAQRKSAMVSNLAILGAQLSTALDPRNAGINATTERTSRENAASAIRSAGEMEAEASEKRRLWAETRATAMRLRGLTSCENEVAALWLLSAESDHIAVESRVKSGEGQKKRFRKEWWGRVATMRDRTTGYLQRAAQLCGE